MILIPPLGGELVLMGPFVTTGDSVAGGLVTGADVTGPVENTILIKL